MHSNYNLHVEFNARNTQKLFQIKKNNLLKIHKETSFKDDVTRHQYLLQGPQ